MESPRLFFSGPDGFARSLDNSPVEAWIAARREPYWYRPAMLGIFVPRMRRSSEERGTGDPSADWNRAAQLRREMSLFARKHGAPAQVTQLYWSAGVTELAEPALRAVHAALVQSFDVAAGARFTARLVAPSLKAPLLAVLREFGVTTLHLAAAFDAPHSLERLVEEARAAGFNSVAVDIGLDFHGGSMRKARECLSALSACRPSRILLTPGGGAGGSEPVAGRDARARRSWHEIHGNLITSGYEYVAHNVFAMHTDAFARAKRTAMLMLTPFGYGAYPAHVSIAIGQGAIGNVGPMQYQNARDAQSYAAMLRSDALPIERAHLSTSEDLVRRMIVAGLLTDFSVDVESIEASYNLDFRAFFRRECVALEQLEGEGVVQWHGTLIRLTPAGRFDCGRVADLFDRRSPGGQWVRPGRNGPRATPTV